MRSLKILVVVGLALLLLQAAGRWAVSRVDRQNNRVVTASNLPAPGAAAQNLHSRLLVADLHADPLLWPRDLNDRHSWGQIDLPRLLEGNVGLQVFSAVTQSPRNLNYESNDSDSDNITLLAIASGWPPATWTSTAERALYQADKLHRYADQSGGKLVIIRDRSQLEQLIERRENGEAVVGALLALEGAHPLEGQLENVDRLFEAGYRMMGLTHFFDNEVAGSQSGVEKGGLTEFGRKAVNRAQELGMVIDLAHASARASLELLELSSQPLVISHSGLASKCPQHGRNVDEGMLRRLVRNGGVLGLGLWPQAICGQTLEAFLDSVDAAVEIAGRNHVGLGSDFDGHVSTPIDAAGWAQVTAGLMARGYRDDEIARIMGGNVIRVLRQSLPAASEPGSATTIRRPQADGAG